MVGSITRNFCHPLQTPLGMAHAACLVVHKPSCRGTQQDGVQLRHVLRREVAAMRGRRQGRDVAGACFELRV